MNISVDTSAVTTAQTGVEALAASALPVKAADLTPENYAKAGPLLREIKGKAKDLEAMRVSLVKPLNDHVSSINAMFKPMAARLAEAEQWVKGFILRFEDAERQRVRAEEDRLRREAEERQRIERERVAKEREEAEAKAEQERKEIEARAAAAAAAGKTRTAEALQAKAAQVQAAPVAEAPVVIAPVVVPRAAPTAGVVTAQRWAFEVVDASVIPDEYWEINQTALRRAVMVDPANCKIPGVRVFKETVVRA